MHTNYCCFQADWIQRNKPPIDWPQKGTIKFCNYKTRYRIGLELVLSGVDCFIENGERVWSYIAPNITFLLSKLMH